MNYAEPVRAIFRDAVAKYPGESDKQRKYALKRLKASDAFPEFLETSVAEALTYILWIERGTVNSAIRRSFRPVPGDGKPRVGVDLTAAAGAMLWSWKDYFVDGTPLGEVLGKDIPDLIDRRIGKRERVERELRLLNMIWPHMKRRLNKSVGEVIGDERGQQFFAEVFGESEELAAAGA